MSGKATGWNFKYVSSKGPTSKLHNVLLHTLDNSEFDQTQNYWMPQYEWEDRFIWELGMHVNVVTIKNPEVVKGSSKLSFLENILCFIVLSGET